jgi:hypothetical protein
MEATMPLLQGAIVVSLRPVEGDQEGGLSSLQWLAAQLPSPEDLPPGTMIAVPDVATERKKASLLQRLVRRPEPGIARAARCTAMLARGYVRIGAGHDAAGVDWAWGFVCS